MTGERPRGGVTDLSAATAPPGVIRAEVCIIGSGPAGATAARVLAAAGRDVVVLEEGGDRTGPQLNQRDGEMYDQLYMDRAGRMTSDLSVTVLQGRALGGGGVINASDVVPVPHGVWDHWVKRFGLNHLSAAAMAPYAQRALEDLSANPITEAQVNKANDLLRRGTQTLGLRGELMMHNRQGCAGLGTCLIGCPVNAKRNPRFVAIPRAIEAGARFFTRARAVRIEDGESETKRVLVRALDAKGYHEHAELEVHAPIVILAANAIGSSHLLLRSGLGNDHVGRHVMLQPQLPVVALFEEEIAGYRGIPQAWAVTEHEVEDHPEHGLWGYRIEAIMGTPGIVSSIVPFSGLEVKQVMALYGHIASALLLAPDAPSGAVKVGRGARPEIAYEQRDDHKARLRHAAKVAARIYLSAGARRVVIPTHRPVSITREADIAAVDDLDFAPATAPILSAHQQGGVRMAMSADDGAADPDGKVYGTRGIYVFDSGLFPSSSSSHTMTPIMTVAHYLSERLAAGLPAI